MIQPAGDSWLSAGLDQVSRIGGVAGANAFGAFGAPAGGESPAPFGDAGAAAFGGFGTPPAAEPTDAAFGFGSFGSTQRASADAAFGFGSFGSSAAGASRALGSAAGGYNPRSPGAEAGFGSPVAPGQQMPGAGATGGQVGGAFRPTGARFASGQLDQFANYINAAGTQHGVPPNFLAAIIAQESSGNWNGDGSRFWFGRPQMGPLLPYVGVFELTARTRLGMSAQQFAAMRGNPQGQIDMLARVLRSQYDEIRRRNPAYGWMNVSSYHYSGRPVPDGWTDERGMSNNRYTAQTQQFWGLLEPGFNANAQPGQGGFAGAPGGGAVGDISMVWGGGSYPINQGFGDTPFSRGHTHAGGMYSYSAGLGVKGHAGLDIGTPYGTRIYSATAGTVVVTGSRYFTDARGGIGEIRVRLDNGDEIIYGHMAGANVRVGQRVTPGMLVGTSGTSGGDHLHLEYRRLGGNTSTGFTGVDPRIALGGGTGGIVGGVQPQQPIQAAQRFGNRFWDIPFDQLHTLKAA